MENEPFKLTQHKGSIKNDPGSYFLSDSLKKAVDVALLLNQPLILTGEPGTGKTQLAYKLANELSEQTKGDFYDKPLEFHTKTTTIAQDLFYAYDAIGHFRDSNIAKSKGESGAAPYIALQALGKAIAMTNKDYLQSEKSLIPDVKNPRSSVVLIDEIDKAPRDFPNDILNEIEDFKFSIKELREKVEKSNEKRILIIMTSNSEKSLPAPFLRRCVFYHIPFPDTDDLIKIVSNKITAIGDLPEEKVRKAVEHFNSIREQVKKKQPATSELISWMHVLEIEKFFVEDVDFKNLSDDQKNILKFSYSVLLKDKDDYKEQSEAI